MANVKYEEEGAALREIRKEKEGGRLVCWECECITDCV